MNIKKTFILFGLILGIFLLFLLESHLGIPEKVGEKGIFLSKSEEVLSDDSSNIGLYEVKKEGHSFYVTIDSSENQDYTKDNQYGYSFESLHKGDFWDPKRCSQMQSIISKKKIIFLDSVVSTKNNQNFTTLLFIFDIESKSLTKLETEINITKIFIKRDENENGFYAISYDRKDLDYDLYKLDLATNRLIFVKNYQALEDFNLLTATDTLVWCKDFGKVCERDIGYAFDYQNNDFVEHRSMNNAFEAQIFLADREIFRVDSRDKIRYFFIGLKDTMGI